MVRHGFYCSPARTAYPMMMERYYREQAASGMTTCTADGSSLFCPQDPAAGLACQVDALLEVGLAFPGEPLLCFTDPTTAYAANRFATRPWPEIVLNNQDDPSPDGAADVQTMAREAHKLYFKSSLFVNGNFVKELRRGHPENGLLGETVDVWIVQAHTWQHDIEKNAKALGKELWAAYTVGASGRYDHMRYYAGLWAWAHGVKQALVWAYTHSPHTMVKPDGVISTAKDDFHSFAIPRPDGTVMATDGYRGFREGIMDCRLLEAAEAKGDAGIDGYLRGVRAQVPVVMPRPGRMLPDFRGNQLMNELFDLEQERCDP